MMVIVGLGNPGKKFEKTRHNLGRLVISNWRLAAGFPKFKLLKKFQSLISEGVFENEKIILALPQTFMNLSGKSVKSLITNYQLPITNLLVVHDDIDLPLGEIKISIGRGSAGHKGVQSIIDELKTKDFVRFRIGIKPNNTAIKPYSRRAIEYFVLKKFTKEEEKIIKEVIKKTVEAIEFSLKEGIEKAMAKFNK